MSSLLTRITTTHLEAYSQRALTPKQIAQIYNVTPRYVRTTLPKRPPHIPITRAKRALAEARLQYRLILAKRIHERTLTIQQATDLAHCSERHMWRYLQTYRKSL